MRKKLYKTVHVYEGHILSVLYKYIMIFFILLSLIPLMFKEKLPLFKGMEVACLSAFAVDYLLRWSTADFKFRSTFWRSLFRYPFRLISVIDFMSIFGLLCSVNGWLLGFGLTKALTVFRIVRILRYSKNVRTILGILKSSRKPLIAVGSLALGYIAISAIVIFNVEPDSFHTFFDAVYWSTISLTTVGYGDIYPVTVLGRTVSMISSFLGIAIVALPAGIVTAEYMASLKEKK